MCIFERGLAFHTGLRHACMRQCFNKHTSETHVVTCSHSWVHAQNIWKWKVCLKVCSICTTTLQSTFLFVSVSFIHLSIYLYPCTNVSMHLCINICVFSHQILYVLFVSPALRLKQPPVHRRLLPSRCYICWYSTAVVGVGVWVGAEVVAGVGAVGLGVWELQE